MAVNQIIDRGSRQGGIFTRLSNCHSYGFHRGSFQVSRKMRLSIAALHYLHVNAIVCKVH